MDPSPRRAAAVHSDEHDAFAASRSRDFVYVPGDASGFAQLDGHAEAVGNDAKLPLAVLGSPGSGKSALLANWVAERRARRHRDEFLFQHFVGCSARSKQLGQMVRRLEAALKDSFQLRDMEVPRGESAAIWALSRFLEAAAKKQGPARITIVIDGVDALRSNENPEGALHWLPRTLPGGVRVIVSTVRTTAAGQTHRSYAELLRRRCPTVEMAPLGIEARTAIIDAFCASVDGAVAFTDDQKLRLAGAEQSSQPLFLRTALYALHLAAGMATTPFDEFLDRCLAQESSDALIAMVLNACCAHVEGNAGRKAGEDSVFGRVLAAIYVSRDGLSDDEIWGVAERFLGRELPASQRDKVPGILRGMTMVVGGLRSFSHEAFRRVVFRTFIGDAARLVQMHQAMARFFDQLPPCGRKVEALPYHLEVAGSWTRLRDALTDIPMFKLWWTPEHRDEFICLWASLSCLRPEKKLHRKLVTGEFEDNMLHRQPRRPFFDPVEEYVRSVNAFRASQRPGDEELARTILAVADFFLESAILGHEEDADVPSFNHPPVTNEDMASLGVAHLDVDGDGRSIIRTPLLGSEPDGKPAVEMPAKTNEDVPERTAYFYRRWMWIQFPLVALANCGERYLRGVAHMEADQRSRRDPAGGAGGAGRAGAGDGPLLSPVRARARRMSSAPGQAPTEEAERAAGRQSGAPEERAQRRHSKLARPLKAPHITRRKKRTEGRRAKDRGDLRGHWERETGKVRDEVEDLKHELDILVQHGRDQESHLKRLTNELTEAAAAAAQTVQSAGRLRALRGKAGKVKENHRKAKVLERNLASVLRICERHPAHSPALVEELEAELRENEALCEGMRQKLRDENHERAAYQLDYRDLRDMVANARATLHGMLERREEQLANLARAAELERSVARNPRCGSRRKRTAVCRPQAAAEADGDVDRRPDEDEAWLARWAQKYRTIAARTGISDPEVFLEKVSNTELLEQQMAALKARSEARLLELREQQRAAEEELEQLRYHATPSGTSHRDVRDVQTALATAQADLRRGQERCAHAERVVDLGRSGLLHISAALGLSEDSDAAVEGIIRQIEAVLGALMEERGTAAREAESDAARGSVGADAPPARTPELEAALQSCASRGSRVALRLSGKSGAFVPDVPGSGFALEAFSAADSEDQDIDEAGHGRGHGDSDESQSEDEYQDEVTGAEGVPGRKLVKALAMRNLRLEQRRAARRSTNGPATS